MAIKYVPKPGHPGTKTVLVDGKPIGTIHHTATGIWKGKAYGLHYMFKPVVGGPVPYIGGVPALTKKLATIKTMIAAKLTVGA